MPHAKDRTKSVKQLQGHRRRKRQTFSQSILIAIIGFSALTTQHADAQPVGKKVGPQFPFLTSSARVAALADASGAIIDDFSGFGSNPAVLGFMKKSIIDYSYQRVQKGISFEHLGMSYRTTTLDAIAFGIDLLHFGGMDFYTKSDVRNLGYEMRTGLAYGRLLGETFSMGINLQAMTTTTGPTSVWAFAGDIGFAYTPGKYIRYGFVLKGISSDYKVAPSLLQTDSFTARIARLMALSLALDFPFSERTKKILVALQNEKIFGEKDIIYKIGVEYYPRWTPTFKFALRGGLIVRDVEVQPRFGLGASYSQLSLDYAYGYIRETNQPSHMLTLSYSWF